MFLSLFIVLLGPGSQRLNIVDQYHTRGKAVFLEVMLETWKESAKYSSLHITPGSMILCDLQQTDVHQT